MDVNVKFPQHSEGTWWSRVTAPVFINPLKTELNSICHLLALLGAHHIIHVSRIRVKIGVK